MKDLAATLLNQGGEFRIVKYPRGAFQLMMRIIEKLQWTRFVREDIDLDRRDMPSGVILAENRTTQPNNCEQSKGNISPGHRKLPPDGLSWIQVLQITNVTI
jgi:hypothetical protein